MFKLNNFAKKIFSTVCAFSIFMICGIYNVKAELTDILTYSNSTYWYDFLKKEWVKETRKYRKDLRCRIINFLNKGKKWKNDGVIRFKGKKVFRKIYLCSYKCIRKPLSGTKICLDIYRDVDFVVDAHTVDSIVLPMTIFMTLKDDFSAYSIDNIRKIFCNLCNRRIFPQDIFGAFIFRKESGKKFSKEEIDILNNASKFKISDGTSMNAKFIVKQ